MTYHFASILYHTVGGRENMPGLLPRIDSANESGNKLQNVRKEAQ